MTVTTIDAVIANVVLMAELNWLLALDVGAGVPTRTHDLGRNPERGKQNKNRAKDRGSRQIVRAMTENLWHLPQTTYQLQQADSSTQNECKRGRSPNATSN